MPGLTPKRVSCSIVFGYAASLLAVQNANSLADHRARIGATVEVLVEGLSKFATKAHGWQPVGAGPRQLTGRSMTDHIVVFDGSERLIGQTVRVAVRDASAFTLYGDAVTGEYGPAQLEGSEPALPGRIALPLL